MIVLRYGSGCLAGLLLATAVQAQPFVRVTDAGPIVTQTTGAWGSSWGDYDGDGDVDLFVGGDQGDVDLFYENEGGGRLTRRTDLPFIRPGAFSAGGSWVDLDHDGDEDLFVVNFMRTNNELYRNLRAETGVLGFEPVTTGDIVRDFEDDLVPGWGDYDNDGDLDAFMAVWNNRNNALFRNDGDLNFTRIFDGSVVNDQGLSLGNAWLDYDNDGDLDLFVVEQQGFDRLYRNEGGGEFTKMTGSDVGGIVSTNAGFASGASVADYDNDGDLDVYVPVSGGPNLLYRNDGGNANNWVNLTLRGTSSNRQGIGARVWVKATIDGEARWQLRQVTGGPTGDRAQSSQRVHVGLGNAPGIDSLRIEWPSGQVDQYAGLAVNQFLGAIENQTASPVASEGEPPLPEAFVLHPNYPNPFNPSTAIAYTLPRAARVTLRVFDLLGREVVVPVDARQAAGTHTVQITLPASAPSGVYLYRITAGTASATRAMTLVR